MPTTTIDPVTGYQLVSLDPGDDSYNDTNSNASIVAGNSGNDTIDGGGGSDFILGNRGDDNIDGGTGRDVLYGGRGDDFINGGAGRDFLSGDFGADTLSGGSGADTFFFSHATAGFDEFGGTAVDTVLDYSAAQGDKLLLDGFGSYATAIDSGNTLVYGDGNLIAILQGYTGALVIEEGPRDYSDYTPF